MPPSGKGATTSISRPGISAGNLRTEAINVSVPPPRSIGTISFPRKCRVNSNTRKGAEREGNSAREIIDSGRLVCIHRSGLLYSAGKLNSAHKRFS